MLQGPEEKYINIVKRARLFHSYCGNKAMKVIGKMFHFVWLLIEGWGPEDIQRVISSWNKYKDLKIIVSDLNRDALVSHGFKEKFFTKSYSMKGLLRGSTCQRQVNLHLVSIDCEVEEDAEESNTCEEDKSIEKDGDNILIDDEDIKAHLLEDVSLENLDKRLSGVVFQLDEEKSSRKHRNVRRIGGTDQSKPNPKKNNRKTTKKRSSSDSGNPSKRIKTNKINDADNDDDNNNNNNDDDNNNNNNEDDDDDDDDDDVLKFPKEFYQCSEDVAKQKLYDLFLRQRPSSTSSTISDRNSITNSTGLFTSNDRSNSSSGPTVVENALSYLQQLRLSSEDRQTLIAELMVDESPFDQQLNQNIKTSAVSI